MEQGSLNREPGSVGMETLSSHRPVDVVIPVLSTQPKARTASFITSRSCLTLVQAAVCTKATRIRQYYSTFNHHDLPSSARNCGRILSFELAEPETLREQFSQRIPYLWQMEDHETTPPHIRMSVHVIRPNTVDLAPAPPNRVRKGKHITALATSNRSERGATPDKCPTRRTISTLLETNQTPSPKVSQLPSRGTVREPNLRGKVQEKGFASVLCKR